MQAQVIEQIKNIICQKKVKCFESMCKDGKYLGKSQLMFPDWYLSISLGIISKIAYCSWLAVKLH